MKSVFLAFLAAAITLHAEVIDRIAVSVEQSVITESEVVRQIRITALLNGEEPNLSPENRRDTAERLVNQALIRREIATSRYSPSSGEQADAMYKAFRGRFATEQEYQQALSKYLLTEADVRQAFQWQATFLEFVGVRFRPAIQIPEEEIRAYYDDHVKDKATPEAGASFEEARPNIEEILTQQRLDNALDRWLGQTRTQMQIRYREDAFR